MEKKVNLKHTLAPRHGLGKQFQPNFYFFFWNFQFLFSPRQRSDKGWLCNHHYYFAIIRLSILQRIERVSSAVSLGLGQKFIIEKLLIQSSRIAACFLSVTNTCLYSKGLTDVSETGPPSNCVFFHHLFSFVVFSMFNFACVPAALVGACHKMWLSR